MYWLFLSSTIGLEGLNFDVSIPYNIKDYVVGIRYKV